MGFAELVFWMEFSSRRLSSLPDSSEIVRSPIALPRSTIVMTGPLSGNAGPTCRAAAAWWRRAADRFRNQLTTDSAPEYEQGATAILERQDLPQLRQRNPRLRRAQVRGGTSLVPVLDMTLLLENGHGVIEAIPTASTRLRPILPAFPPRVHTGYQLGQTACLLQ